MKIEDLVKDWGGFEKFVAKLHETGDVRVEHNVTLVGASGALPLHIRLALLRIATRNRERRPKLAT